MRREDALVTPASPQTASLQIQYEDPMNTEPDTASVVTVSLNVAEIENLFSIEEGKYFEHSLGHFVRAWTAISLGEKFMNMYTIFCRKRFELSPKFFGWISSAFYCICRERLLNFVTSIDEMRSLPAELQFKLLKKGLPITEVMPLV